jgi:hypothetical protein
MGGNIKTDLRKQMEGYRLDLSGSEMRPFPSFGKVKNRFSGPKKVGCFKNFATQN